MIKLLISQYYNVNKFERNNKKYISIGHIEPWKNSFRTEEVIEFDVTDKDPKTAETIYKSMILCVNVLNEHMKEIKEYYIK
jgi:hypothetical protein